MEVPEDITGWEVKRSSQDMSRIKVLLDDAAQRPGLIAKLRHLLPELREKPIADLLAEARTEGGIDLGEDSHRAHRKIIESLLHAGFQWTSEDWTLVSHFPIHYAPDGQRSGLIIEDEHENEEFCLELIRRGAPVIDDLSVEF